MSGHWSRSFWEWWLSGKAIYQRLRNYLNASNALAADGELVFDAGGGSVVRGEGDLPYAAGQ